MKKVLCSFVAALLVAAISSPSFAGPGTGKKLGKNYKGVTCSHAKKSHDAGKSVKTYRKNGKMGTTHHQTANKQKKWTKPVSFSRNPMKGISAKKSFVRVGNKPTWMAVNRRG